MKDLVIAGTGNSRSLKSNIGNLTWEQARSMLQAGTFPIDLMGLNPAGVTQTGTPLNKANLLSDLSRISLGLEDGEETVSDAFTHLAKWHIDFITTSGQWQMPINAHTKVHIMLIGGGGGRNDVRAGSSGSYSYPGGAGSGYITEADLELAPGSLHTVVIGAAGAVNTTGGTDGGNTSFDDVIALGGKRGHLYSIDGDSDGGDGGAGGGGGYYSGTGVGGAGGNGQFGGGGGGGKNGRGGNGGTWGGGGAGGNGAPNGTSGAHGTLPGTPGSFGEMPEIYALLIRGFGLGTLAVSGNAGGGFCAPGGKSYRSSTTTTDGGGGGGGFLGKGGNSNGSGGAGGALFGCDAPDNPSSNSGSYGGDAGGFFGAYGGIQQSGAALIFYKGEGAY